MFDINVGDLSVNVLLAILIANLGLLLIALRSAKEVWQRILLVFISITVFLYSGYGIAYENVPDYYGYKYVIYMACLYIPFIVYAKRHKALPENYFTNFDRWVLKNRRTIKIFAFTYLLCEIIPLVYPEFRLFNAFKTVFGSIVGIYDKIIDAEGNTFLSLLNTLKLFLLPFFIAYLTQLKRDNPNKNGLPVALLCIDIFLKYSYMTYLSRYQMVIYALLIFLLIRTPAFKIDVNVKSIATIIVIGIIALPLLYTFTYTRSGETYTGSTRFGNIVSLLLESETYYPIHYEHIVSSVDLAGQTARSFILWILCLPIPSVLWPGKPKISADAFTYSLSGLRRNDANYASSLPSNFGEALMFFDEHTYWIHALIVGTVIICVIGYVAKHKTMSFYALYLIVYSLTLGRGGASSYLSTLINGVISIVLIDLFLAKRPSKYGS